MITKAAISTHHLPVGFMDNLLTIDPTYLKFNSPLVWPDQERFHSLLNCIKQNCPNKWTVRIFLCFVRWRKYPWQLGRKDKMLTGKWIIRNWNWDTERLAAPVYRVLIKIFWSKTPGIASFLARPSTALLKSHDIYLQLLLHYFTVLS